jgi:hypothetical protein
MSMLFVNADTIDIVTDTGHGFAHAMAGAIRYPGDDMQETPFVSIAASYLRITRRFSMLSKRAALGIPTIGSFLPRVDSRYCSARRVVMPAFECGFREREYRRTPTTLIKAVHLSERDGRKL